VTLVQLTAEGKALIDEVYPRHHSFVESRMGVLSAEQLAVLSDAMQTLYDSLSESEL
jgi:DNA-binding MarR family transcriptional regulator